MVKLSIITINLNNADGLRKTIASVMAQTSKDIEYIVIDGGSSDGSVAVIRQYAERISYWLSEPDSGIYNAMNKGIMKASGEYCQFLNSGDCLVASSIIEKMLAAMPVCSIFYGNMLKQLTNGKIYRDKCEQGNISMLTFYRGTLNHSSALIKRSMFAQYGLYDENLKVVSDWKFYLLAVGLHQEPIQYVDLDVTCFNMAGISNTHTALEKQERRQVLQEYLPANILADYDQHWFAIEQMKRLNRYKWTKWLVWFMERCLFKWEKNRGLIK